MAFTLQLTGASVGDLDLNDQTKPSGAHPYSIMVQNWRPRVARRRTGRIGGVPYEDVEEMLPLAVLGYTRAAVLDGLGDLAAALDEAELWRLGVYDKGPVLFKWKPEGSSLTNPVQAAVLGPGSGDDLLSLQPAFNKDLQAYYVECEAGLIRRGQWLGDEDTHTGSAVSLPAVATATSLTALDIPGPQYMKMVFSNLTTSPSAYTYMRGFLFFSDLANTVLVKNAGGISSSWSTVADSTASGGSFIRSPLTSNIFYVDSLLDLTGLIPTGRYAVAAMIRNRSNTLTYSVRLWFDSAVGGDIYTRWVKIPPSSGVIEPIFVGVLDVDKDSNGSLYMQIEPSATITSGHELDMDTVAIACLHDTSQIMSVYGVGTDFIQAVFNNGYLAIDHNLLTKYSPGVYLSYITSAVGIHAGRSGDAYIAGKGTTAYMMAFLHSSGSWQVHGSDGNQVQGTLTCTRRPAYLVVK